MVKIADDWIEEHERDLFSVPIMTSWREKELNRVAELRKTLAATVKERQADAS